MATTEDKATFIYLVQQWVQTTGINLGFYWTSKIPDATTPEDAIIGIKNESFIPETEEEIKNGWFSFIMDNFRNKKDEPFVFSFNSDYISKVFYSKDANKPYFKVYSRPRSWLKALFCTPINICIEKDLITIKSGKKIEAEYVKKE